MVIFSADRIDDKYWIDDSLPSPILCHNILMYSDSDLVGIIENTNCFDKIGFKCTLTMGRTSSAVAREKEENIVSAVLVPRTSQSVSVNFTYFSSELSMGRHGFFIKLYDLNELISGAMPEPRMTIHLGGSVSSELHSVVFYGPEGDKRAVDYIPGFVDASNELQFFMPWNGIDTNVSVYIDCTGTGINMNFMGD